MNSYLKISALRKHRIVHFLLNSFNFEYKDGWNKVVVHSIFTKYMDSIVLWINFFTFKDFKAMFCAKW